MGEPVTKRLLILRQVILAWRSQLVTDWYMVDALHNPYGKFELVAFYNRKSFFEKM